MPWFKSIITVWKPIGNGAVDQEQFWNHLHHNSYSASSVGFHFSHTDVSEWLEHLLGLKSHRALQSPQHLGHKQRLQFLYHLHTDSSSHPQMLQGNGCQADRICTVVCQFYEGSCLRRYQVLLLRASIYALIYFNFKAEIAQVFGTARMRIIVMQCLGFLCGLLYCMFFSTMFIIMWHFYSIGESLFTVCSKGHYLTLIFSGSIIGILSLYVLADTLVFIPFYGTSKCICVDLSNL